MKGDDQKPAPAVVASLPVQEDSICAQCGWRRSLHKKSGPRCLGVYLADVEISENTESQLAHLQAALLVLKGEMEQSIKANAKLDIHVVASMEVSEWAAKVGQLLER